MTEYGFHNLAIVCINCRPFWGVGEVVAAIVTEYPPPIFFSHPAGGQCGKKKKKNFKKMNTAGIRLSGLRHIPASCYPMCAVAAGQPAGSGKNATFTSQVECLSQCSQELVRKVGNRLLPSCKVSGTWLTSCKVGNRLLPSCKMTCG